MTKEITQMKDLKIGTKLLCTAGCSCGCGLEKNKEYTITNIGISPRSRSSDVGIYLNTKRKDNEADMFFNTGLVLFHFLIVVKEEQLEFTF